VKVKGAGPEKTFIRKKVVGIRPRSFRFKIGERTSLDSRRSVLDKLNGEEEGAHALFGEGVMHDKRGHGENRRRSALIAKRYGEPTEGDATTEDTHFPRSPKKSVTNTEYLSPPSAAVKK